MILDQANQIGIQVTALNKNLNTKLRESLLKIIMILKTIKAIKTSKIKIKISQKIINIISK